MNIKTLVKLTTLAALLTWGVPARAAKFWNVEVYVASGSIHVGYANGAGSIRPGLTASDRVFTSSGAAVVQSTSATSGYKPFRVLSLAASEIFSVTQAGVATAASFVGNLTGNVTGNVTGNTSGTAGSLAANGANCSSGNYPLGVDASGAAEGCTAVGIGDAVLSSTQTFTGKNTFTNIVTISSGIHVTAVPLSTQPANTLTSASFDKGWVVYTSTPATPVIQRSMNVSGLIDQGTGIITVVWNTRFEQEDYVTTCASYRTDITNAAVCNTYAGGVTLGTGDYSPNSVAILTSNFSGTAVDMVAFVRAIGRQ